jgi:cardiolipin synthase
MPPTLRFLLLGPLNLLPACTITRPVTYKLDDGYSIADPQFVNTVSSLLGPPLIAGNEVATLINGDEIFPAMLDAIASAQKTITFETYVYWSGPVGKRFADALSERAKAGVKVHALIDWVGAAQISNDDWNQMKDAGVIIHKYHVFHFYDPFTYKQMDHRTHRKILVIDGVLGFTGGVGIANMWAGNAQDKDHWRDNHYRIKGPVVAQLQAAFADNWLQTTGVVLDGDAYFPRLEPAGNQYGQVFKSSPRGGADTMQLLMLLSIAHAAKTIHIESAYFVPDKITRDALIRSAERGVKIEIIVPGRHIDEKGVRLASRASWGSLLQAAGGTIEIYEYQPTMIHCKLLVVDGLWTSVGSSNMDNRSFRINDEANLNIFDAAFAAEQVGIFNTDKSHSRRITYEQWKNRPLMEKLTAPLPFLYQHEL